jgi:hypothetical protein
MGIDVESCVPTPGGVALAGTGTVILLSTLPDLPHARTPPVLVAEAPPEWPGPAVCEHRRRWSTREPWWRTAHVAAIVPSGRIDLALSGRKSPAPMSDAGAHASVRTFCHNAAACVPLAALWV